MIPLEDLRERESAGFEAADTLTALVNLLGGQSIRRFESRRLALAQILQGDQPLTFTPFDGHGVASLVYQEMFQGCEQVRTQAPFLLAHRVQIPAFQQQSKKTLS